MGGVTLPTADDVARAIVAAARETGEDPIDCIKRVAGRRCRHYAMHALLHVFQDLGREPAAHLVGCPALPRSFWYNSWHQVVKPNWKGRPQAKWWDVDVLGRVIKVIEARVPVAAAKPVAQLPALIPQRPLVLPPNMQGAIDAAKAAVPSTLDKLNTRRRVVPACDCENVTSELMGDPPPSRSALANR